MSAVAVDSGSKEEVHFLASRPLKAAEEPSKVLALELADFQRY